MTWCVNVSGVYGETKLLREYKLNTILNVITSFCITDTQDNYGRKKNRMLSLEMRMVGSEFVGARN